MGKIHISKTEKNLGAEYEVVCFYTAMIYIFECRNFLGSCEEDP